MNLVDSIERAREPPDHLIIVDPSLKDHIGHHAEYDRAVARSAREAGIGVTVLAHRRVVRDVAAGIPLVPVFSNDIWGNAPVGSRWSSSVAIGLFRCVQLCAILPAALFNACFRTRNRLIRKQAPAARNGPEAGSAGVPNESGVDADRSGSFVPGPAPDTLSLRTRIIRSWHKHGTLHVIRTAVAVLGRSIRFVLTRLRIPGATLLIRILSVVPFTASVAWNCAALCFGRIRIPSILAVLFISNPRYFFEASKAIRASAPSAGTLVFFHMVIYRNLLESVLLAAQCGRKWKTPAVVLFRYPPSLCGPDRFQTRLAFRLLERVVQEGFVRVVTDSYRLAMDYADHTWIPIEVVPIPHGPASGSPGETSLTVGKRRIRFASLGNARAEKGILEIIQAIEILNAGSDRSDIEFVLQINDPSEDCREAVRRLQTSSHAPNVTLIGAAMDAGSYEALLASVDVVLVPYWREIYWSRTSGIFLEAVTSGKPVIVTSDTWMSDELQRWGAGIAIPDHDPCALADAIERVGRDYGAFSERAVSAARSSREFHSSVSFLRHLCGQKRTRFVKDRRVLVSFPWGNLFLRDSGASLRATLLIELLRSEGYAVIAHCTSDVAVRAAPPGVECVLYRGTGSSLREPRFLAATVMRLVRWPWRYEARDLWFRFEFWCRERPFRLLMNRALYDCGAVFLKYPFLADVFAPLCRGHGVPLTVSDYDVLSLQIRNRMARREMLQLESAAMKRADLAVCVSEDDAAVFEKWGCNAVVISNAIDIEGIFLPGAERARQILERRGVVLPHPFCLFVGSHHPPNLEAVRQMGVLAGDLRMRSADMNFVAAGNCRIDGMERSGLVQLGRVPGDTLAALYALAAFVVVPLLSGTGTSLKIIEAMGYGKVVIGTRIAFRGIPVRDGVEAIVVEGVDQIADIISGLCRDSGRIAEIGQCARKLSRKYGVRQAFEPYLVALAQTQCWPAAPPRLAEAYPPGPLTDSSFEFNGRATS